MKQLSVYRISKYKETYYIPKFIKGVSEAEFIDMFTNHMLNGFITLQIGKQYLDSINKITMNYADKKKIQRGKNDK